MLGCCCTLSTPELPDKNAVLTRTQSYVSGLSTNDVQAPASFLLKSTQPYCDIFAAQLAELLNTHNSTRSASCN